MFSRREFIHQGLAASALVACPPALSYALPGSDASSRVFTVLVDRTTLAAGPFSSEALRRGAPVHAVGRDPGGAWMHRIEPHWQHARAERRAWRDAPLAVAGLTGGESLFCLELLARDYGMGVIHRAEHVPRAGGDVGHIVTNAEFVAVWEHRLAAAGHDWGAVAAAAAMSAAELPQPHTYLGLVDPARQPGSTGPSFFSWVIAPIGRPAVSARHRA